MPGYGKVKPEAQRMIRMGQYSFIRTAHRVYGKSTMQISRETGHCRKIIRKVLRQELFGYTNRQQQAYPILGVIYRSSTAGWRRTKTAPRSNVIRPSGFIIAYEALNQQLLAEWLAMATIDSMAEKRR
jgi:hypothetical protein